MKIYISGPMTGKKNMNREEFALYEQYFNECTDYVPVNPHKIEITSETVITYDTYMRHDICALMECDAIFMLKGWVFSNGARIERIVAWLLGIKRIKI